MNLFCLHHYAIIYYVYYKSVANQLRANAFGSAGNLPGRESGDDEAIIRALYAVGGQIVDELRNGRQSSAGNFESLVRQITKEQNRQMRMA